MICWFVQKLGRCIIPERQCIGDNSEGYQGTDQEHLRIRRWTLFLRLAGGRGHALRWTGAIRSRVRFDRSGADLSPIANDNHREADQGKDELFHYAIKPRNEGILFRRGTAAISPVVWCSHVPIRVPSSSNLVGSTGDGSSKGDRPPLVGERRPVPEEFADLTALYLTSTQWARHLPPCS